MLDVTQRVCLGTGSWTGDSPYCYRTQGPDICVSGIYPKCASRVSSLTRITITGANFNSNLAVIFNDKNSLKNGTVHSVDSDQMIVSPAKYLEHNDVPFPYEWYKNRNQVSYSMEHINKTSKGTLVVLDNGEPVRWCQDNLGQGQARRVFEFSYSVGWPASPPLLATDYSLNRIVQVDPDTGITFTLIDGVEGFPLERPYGLDIGPDGALYVATAAPSHGRILRYNVTGQFLGVWADVPGEPKGLRWERDQLYVASWNTNRVLRYRHHMARVNKAPNHMQNILGTYQGPFTQDLSEESPGGVEFKNPYELRFHPVAAQLKLFVSSAGTGHIFQFDGENGVFERVLTASPMKYLTGFGLSFSQDSSDIYAVGMYAGHRIGRFNVSSGEMVSSYKDKWLVRNAGLVTHDGSMYVTAGDEIRQYATKETKLIRVATKVDGSEFGFVTIGSQCN